MRVYHMILGSDYDQSLRVNGSCGFRHVPAEALRNVVADHGLQLTQPVVAVESSSCAFFASAHLGGEFGWWNMLNPVSGVFRASE